MDLRDRFATVCSIGWAAAWACSPCLAVDFPVVDTGQRRCYDNLHPAPT